MTMPEKQNTLLKGKTIMWVEDDVFLNDIIARKCKANECNLIHATNGEDALEKIRGKTPDIIVLDILLPGMNGYEILEKFKKDQTTANIPVMILSNYGQKSEVEKGLNLGAVKYLVKATYTLDEIMLQISQILQDITDGKLDPKGKIASGESAPSSVKPTP